MTLSPEEFAHPPAWFIQYAPEAPGCETGGLSALKDPIVPAAFTGTVSRRAFPSA